MRHRTVADLMAHDVVRVRPDTPFKEIVRLLRANDVTAVPVMDELDRPVGLVSEADLLRRGRGDLLRVFLRRDDAIRDEITLSVLHETLNLTPSLVPVIERLCQDVDGVVSVQAHLDHRVDAAD